MSDKIVITKIEICEQDLLFYGRMERERLIEVHLDRFPSGSFGETDSADGGSVVLGGIYIGRVQRVVKNLNAAFVEIVPGVFGYLSLKHASDPIFIESRSPGRIAQEDQIVVQVSREAMGSKAPTLSTNLNVAGRYAVVTTQNTRLGLSSKLDPAAREHFKSLLSKEIPAGRGLIVRTNAAQVSDEDLLAEIQRLNDQADHIVAHAQNHTCFSCLYRPDPPCLSYLKGMYSKEVDEIVTDIPSVFDTLREYCRDYPDLGRIPLRLYTDPTFPLASLYNLNREMTRATAKEVRLKSGGFLVIEPTEAMTVIDVNTGKSDSKKESSEHFLEINREASREIARQLRVRNLSGIVIIDYIDLDSEERQKELLNELKLLVKSDPIPVRVHDITALNLVELTRKKTEKTLSEQIKRLTIKNAL